MGKILVAVAFYPDDKGNKRLYYTHVRNKYYQQEGLDVTVLNFSTDHHYNVDGIHVITLDEYKKCNDKYDILICHAANIRNHYRFLKKYQSDFRKIVFFFHGHEIMHIKKYYPKPYSFKARHYLFKSELVNIYDTFKLKLWRNFFLSDLNKIKLIFVSNWIKDVFLEETRIKAEYISDNSKVINNSIGAVFEKESYQIKTIKKYDFITIRNYLDDSKYAIDLVMRDAKAHPEYKFCLIGKGSYFQYNILPKNVELVQRELSHKEMLKFLNKSYCGLMPTREDTQGVMTCEMATFGLPVITSNIDVCREIFAEMNNVFLASNSKDLTIYYSQAVKAIPTKKNERYFFKNTVKKEIDMLYRLSI
ncbi:glycosyltransferase [Latilactobacillus curvatus]|uniref:glycosyltransferase n=1 Tax=Latilactobacillus curvatus TaxID=28038 RepID=UPI002D78E015|nr:glycosyltransferase [Latilactobacillus curvatus]WRS46837.1 glycosyltransferase [Latilactobacillus curvatus]